MVEEALQHKEKSAEFNYRWIEHVVVSGRRPYNFHEQHYFLAIVI